MNKLFSLIKATMSQDMNLFKIRQKNQSKISKILFPIALGIVLMFCIGIYAQSIAELLKPIGLMHVLLSIFIFYIICFLNFIFIFHSIKDFIFIS